MCALLYDAAVVHHTDQVRILHSRQTVCDEKHCVATQLDEAVQGLLNLCFALRIKSAAQRD
jgi:hypothetical protein